MLSLVGQAVRMNLDVESLRTLLVVTETGQITAAAKQLNLTQSAVSRKLQRLERRVGQPLVDRNGHTIAPTHAGRELLDDAATIVATHDRAVARLATSQISGRVRVGTTEEVRPADLTGVFGEFNRLHPAAFVELVIDASDRLIGALDRGDLDVIVLQLTEDMRRSDDILLWTDELRWYSNRYHTYSEGPVPLVTYGDVCFYTPLSEPLLDAAGIEHWTSMALSSTSAVINAIEAGLGVGVLASRVASADLVEWQRAAELPPLPPVHQVVRYVRRNSDAAVTALAEALSEGFEPVSVA